jgi:hypothetical protein
MEYSEEAAVAARLFVPTGSALLTAALVSPIMTTLDFAM